MPDVRLPQVRGAPIALHGCTCDRQCSLASPVCLSAVLYNLPRLEILDDKAVSATEVAAAKSDVLAHAISRDAGAGKAAGPATSPAPPGVAQPALASTRSSRRPSTEDDIIARLQQAGAELEAKMRLQRVGGGEDHHSARDGQAVGVDPHTPPFSDSVPPYAPPAPASFDDASLASVPSSAAMATPGARPAGGHNCPTCGCSASSAFMDTLAMLREAHAALLQTNRVLLEQVEGLRTQHAQELTALAAHYEALLAHPGDTADSAGW